MADICFLVLVNLLALAVRQLVSFVIATVFVWDFLLEVFDRRVRLSPCTISDYLGIIQGQRYPVTDD